MSLLSFRSLAVASILSLPLLAAPPAVAAPISPAPPLSPTGAVSGAALCKDFAHNPDQSWTARHGVIVKGPNSTYPSRTTIVVVSPYQVFTQGVIYSDIDIAALLDKTCLKEG